MRAWLRLLPTFVVAGALLYLAGRLFGASDVLFYPACAGVLWLATGARSAVVTMRQRSQAKGSEAGSG